VGDGILGFAEEKEGPAAMALGLALDDCDCDWRCCRCCWWSMEVLRIFEVDGPACDATTVILAVGDLAAAVVISATNEGVDLWCFAVEGTKAGRCD